MKLHLEPKSLPYEEQTLYADSLQVLCIASGEPVSQKTGFTQRPSHRRNALFGPRGNESPALRLVHPLKEKSSFIGP